METAQIITLKGRLADAPVTFSFEPSEEARVALVKAYDLLALRKTRLNGTLHPERAQDWRLEATLGATVVQPCVVTLAPVTTRIDQPLTRSYLADPGPIPEAGEVEMPEDDTIEALPDEIDLAALFAEALALALPDFPRAPDAALETQTFSAPGVTPLSDDDTKPFAGLKALRATKSNPEDTSD